MEPSNVKSGKKLWKLRRGRKFSISGRRDCPIREWSENFYFQEGVALLKKEAVSHPNKILAHWFLTGMICMIYKEPLMVFILIKFVFNFTEKYITSLFWRYWPLNAITFILDAIGEGWYHTAYCGAGRGSIVMKGGFTQMKWRVYFNI